MRRSARILTVTTLLMASWLGTAGVQSPQAHAESSYGGASWWEYLYCASHYDACAQAQDAQAWAFGVTAWLFPEGGHNDVADAFRHCAWSGAMSQRLGYEQAVEITANHELNEGQPAAEYDMDVANNAVGLWLGGLSAYEGGDDTWGWIMGQCESYARSGQLYGLGGELGNY